MTAPMPKSNPERNCIKLVAMEGGRGRAFPKAFPKAAVVKVFSVCFEVGRIAT
jgi:hypothetical protein